MFSFLRLLDWIYPITCELCGAESERSICPTCLAKMRRVPRPICLRCGCPVESGTGDAMVCRQCRHVSFSFDFARHVFEADQTLLSLVYRLKYYHANYLASAFAPAFAELWRTIPEQHLGEWALVPVPITKIHRRQRGYNQAHALARELSKLIHIPVHEALQRMETGISSQTRLSARQRRQNACEAISVAKPYTRGKIRIPPCIAIIDDIYTTGATACACATALRRLPGIHTVIVLTLLHTAHKKI